MTIVLRELEEEYYPLILSWWNEPQLRFLRGLPVARMELHDVQHRYEQPPDRMRAFLLETPEQDLVGIVDILKPRQLEDRAFIDILIGSQGHWGKGLGVDALRQAAQLAFTRMNIGLLEAVVPSHNKRALRVFDKARFNREEILVGRFDMGDRAADGILFSLAKTDFSKTPPA